MNQEKIGHLRGVSGLIVATGVTWTIISIARILSSESAFEWQDARSVAIGLVTIGVGIYQWRKVRPGSAHHRD